MGWAFLFLILVTLVIVLSVSLISLKIQIYKVTGQLHAILGEDKKEMVTISLGDKGLEYFAETINEIIMKEKDDLAEIQKREDRLKEAISCLSHDLRTPLTSIRGYLKLLENAPEEKQAEYRKVIYEKALKLEYLIDEFYQISLLEDGRYPFEYENLDISELLTEILLENYPLFQEKGIVPEMNLPDQPAMIHIDRKACIRIIQNLLYNAIEKTSGGVCIKLVKADDKIYLTVGNPVNDRMIPELDKIFERFYMKDEARKTGHSGQGLYVVKKLLTEMGCEEPQAHMIDNCFSILIKWKIADKC